MGELCKQTGTLLLVDTVCSLGGVPLFADAWGVDAIYSGSQKCLSGPPGAAPLFFSQKAMEKLQRRKTVPATYNLDLNLVCGTAREGRVLIGLQAGLGGAMCHA